MRSPRLPALVTAMLNSLLRTILAAGLVGFMAAAAQNVRAEAVYIIPPAGDGSIILMYKGIHYSGNVITKPACYPSMHQRIFVTPVRMLGGYGDPLNPIAGVSTFAIDNGNGSWTIRGQVKTAGSLTIEAADAIAMIVELYCCVDINCN
ncbi:MAG: hypothetical protein KA801_10510 [Syntrophorhabdaceae bacterium]|nr:hypothetical protein [Syntrophorhabdaceae bacterium]